MFFSTATVVKKKETLREREDRRRELSSLMERWQCTVGFEFHVQMNTKHKMFSSKSFPVPHLSHILLNSLSLYQQ